MIMAAPFLLVRVPGILLLVVCIGVAVLSGKHVNSMKGPHINDLNLLLPPRAFNPVGYRLQGTDGCFSWTWDHHDILSVIPEYNETNQCSSSARIISLAPYSGRRVTAIHASDIHSGQVIRCEVFVDKISRIQIFHHSVKLDLDGLATLRVHAFDAEDNVFSSLVGLRFKWELTPVKVGGNVAPHKLIHVPLSNTPLSDCGGFCGHIATRVNLEESGYASDLYVVRGIDIGRESVSVRLAEPDLGHLSDSIVLTVAEAMSLEPFSPVFVIVGTRWQYTLKVLRRNKHEAVDLPSPNHHWLVTNTSVASIDSSRGIVNANSIGMTSVVVEDLRVSGHQQISALHVVVPNELHLYLLSWTGVNTISHPEEFVSLGTPWYFITGQEYIVHLKAFSWQSGGRPLFLTENNYLELQFDNLPYWNAFPVPEDITVVHGWQNCSRLVARMEGEGKLSASLKYFSADQQKLSQEILGTPDMVIKITQEVKVCSPVKVYFVKMLSIRQTLSLPWLPGIYQNIELTARGGCGDSLNDYHWHSSDTTVLSVISPGVFQARRPGRSVIRVVAVVDRLNYEEVELDVSVPSSLAMLQGLPVEVAVGSHLPAAVTLRNGSGHHYSRCDAFNSFIQWQIFGAAHTFDIVNNTSWGSLLSLMDSSVASPVCAWTSLYATQAGKASVYAQFSGFGKDYYADLGVPVALKVSWSVATYAPLVIQQVGDGNSFGGYQCDLDTKEWHSVNAKESYCYNLTALILSPGSGTKILFLGGPERWRQGVDFIDTHDIISADFHSLPKESILIKQLTDGGGRLSRISCLSMGKYTVTFKRGNLIGEDHPLPAISEVNLTVICGFPSFIRLIADEPGNTLPLIRAAFQAEYSENHVRSQPVTVTNGRVVRIAAVALHDSGEPFANASSLLLNWTLHKCDGMAYWVLTQKDGKKANVDSWESFLVLHNTSGQCIVRATVSGLVSDKAFLSSLESSIESLQESLDHSISDAVRLQLVSSIHIEPEMALLFYNPDAKATLSIFGGTSAVEAAVNDTSIAFLTQEPSRTGHMNLVVAARGLGAAVITVQDIGLASPSSASALVHVTDVEWIKLVLPEETSILLGSVKGVEVVVGTHHGHTFDSSQIAFMNVHVHLEDDILELVNEAGTPMSPDTKIAGPKFFIRGASIGFTTTFHVSAWQASGHQIFSQFTKVEVYGPLLVHPSSLFLVPGAKYTLTVNGGPQAGVVIEYSSVNNTIAKVDGISGKVLAISSGNTSLRAQAYNAAGDLVCEANGFIHVGIPSSMNLNLGNVQLGVGRELSVFPISSEGDLFSFYELCSDYQWNIEDEQVLQFRKIKNGDLRFPNFTLSRNIGQGYDFDDTSDIGFATRVFGRSAGRTTISVSFSCDFITAGNKRKSISYKAYDTIWVIPDLPLALGVPITWILPPYYTTSEVLPEWIEPSHRRDNRNTRGHVIYSPLMCNGTDDNPISVKGGRIKTSERNSVGCIEARDRATGTTEIASCVRVAEVSRIAVETESFPYHLVELSVGTQQNLLLDYHDGLGNSFYQAHGAVPIIVDVNYPEVVLVKVCGADNKGMSNTGSLCVEALRQGKALVRVTMQSNPPSVNFILIQVGAYISPQNPVLLVGGRLNFTLTGKGFRGSEQGQWTSSDEDVVVVEGASGEIRATGEGTAQVMFKSTRISAYTTVTVVKVASITVSSSHDFLTNVPFPEGGYNFSIKFSDLHGQNYNALGEDLIASYECHVDPAYIGHCRAWRDIVTGSLYCIFVPYTPDHLVRTFSSLRDAGQRFQYGDQNGLLEISIVARLRGAKEVYGLTNVIFKGGFSVVGARELYFTAASNVSSLTIVGSVGAIKFYWQAKDHIILNRVSYRNMGVGAVAKYEVKVIKQESFKDKLEIFLPTTGQKVEIPVQYDPGKFSGTISSFGFTTIIVGTVALVVLSTFIYLRLIEKQEVARQTAAEFNRERTSDTRYADETRTLQRPLHRRTPQTPPPQSQQGLFPQPRTPPQPYTDYIRRTMDHTPHFKRNGVRRLDPSYSY